MIKSAVPDKGGATEELLAAHFREAGFYAIRGLPYRHDDEDITDIDVWLYERGAGAERRRFIVDSKNKARPKLIERLFWTSGARDALGVDGAYVASTGIREPNRRLAKRLRLTIVDLQLLSASKNLASRLTREELMKFIGEADRQRESKKWRGHVNDTLLSLLTSFGGSGGNVALRSAKFFVDEALAAAPSSPSRQLAVRMFYLCLSVAAVSFDFVVSQAAYQSMEKRKQEVEDTVRYGSDYVETKRRLELALEVTRAYLPNGTALAGQIREKIIDDTEAVRADIIAEVAIKMSDAGNLFVAAKDLEVAAHLRELTSFSALSIAAKSFAGVVLDFFEIDRILFAELLE